ncbi:MAG: DUF924 family protein [Acidiferrobacterales bacterium]
MHERVQEILSFWFGDLDDNGLPREDRNTLWFRADRTTDELIRKRFGRTLEEAAGGEIDHWAQLSLGRLALIVLCDQFSRNIYRGTPRAFAQDGPALSLCLEGIDTGHDQTLRAIERVFFYMPLQHSEDLGQQERCTRLHERLLEEAPASAADRLRGFLRHAIQHRDIIRRFGRFPHRNRILGRRSTPQELEYLSKHTSSFGQG